MRASLESANLLTGALLISIDYYPEEEAGEIGTYSGYPTLPSISGGFERIERQVSALLEKLNDMPIEATVRELNGILNDLREVTGSDKFQDLPGTLTAVLDSLKQDLQLISPDSPPYDRLYRTITELNRTLQSADGLLRTLDEKPNSLIFSRPIEPDPEPRGNHR
jgi:paraquat-inducible protein B